MKKIKNKFLFSALPSCLVLMLLLSGLLPAVAKAEPVVSDSTAVLLKKAQLNGAVRVIVGLKTSSFQPEGKLSSAAAVGAQRAAIKTAQSSLLLRLTGVHAGSVKQFETIPFMALKVHAEGMAALAADPEVFSLEEDVAVPATLTESTPLVHAPGAWAAGGSGSGQVVAVLDTGVDKNHPFLSGKVVSEACYSTTDAAYYSTSVCPGGDNISTDNGSAMPYGGVCPPGECDHGTHVAGIAAGKASGSYTYNGVAKDANLIAVQVFTRFDNETYCGSEDPCAMSFISDQILGLERVYALRSTYNIASVNMSLGGGRYYNQATCDAANAGTKAAIDNLRAAGIATVISSGNEAYTDSLGAPACISSAVSVGSTGDGSGGATVDVVSSFSNSASFLNLLAPGRWITSSTPGNTSGTWSGTSMAAPHVAGAWAVLRSSVTAATVDQIIYVLTSTGLPVKDSRNNVTKQRIRVLEAQTALVTGTTSTTTTVVPPSTSTTTITTTTTASVCTDNDGDGYGANCAAGPDCNDNDSFYNEICPECTVKIIPKALGWFLGEKERSRTLIVIGKKDTVYGENTVVRWDTDAIKVLSKKVFFKRFMLLKVSIDGAALDKEEYSALIGDCSGKLTLVK